MAATLLAVITGDVIHSRSVPVTRWLPILKNELAQFGTSPKNWEIYRGDSFQVELKHPHQALKKGMQLKAALKRIKGVDARLAIGIGTKAHAAQKVTESNGTAFIHSGELAEVLKKRKLTMAIRTSQPELDEEINVALGLAETILNRWTTLASETVYMRLSQPDLLQEKLAKKLKIKQNAVSGRLSRASFYEIEALLALFEKKINQYHDSLH
ncbi:MAG: transcriptional regulator [Cyclobacteriaceae bacterium]|nr:transcriptional regulator [Cyclobacteriaceae bacterium]